MKKNIIILLAIFTSLLSFQCEPDEEFLNTLPPITHVGKNSLGAMVNGEVWRNIKGISTRSIGLLSFGTNSRDNHRGLNLGVYIVGNDLFDESGNVIIGKKIYSSPKVDSLYINNDDTHYTITDEFNIYQSNENGFVILNGYSQDTKGNWIISGEFEFQGENLYGDSIINVTSGRFDIKLRDPLEKND